MRTSKTAFFTSEMVPEDKAAEPFSGEETQDKSKTKQVPRRPRKEINCFIPALYLKENYNTIMLKGKLIFW
jgi:hypothetical protein